MDDQNLIARLLVGDPEAVESVRSWIRAAVIPYRRRLAEDLDDLEQEILLQLIEALRAERFQGHSQLRTYVRTYVHHKAIDRIRAAGRREWVPIEGLDLPSGTASALEGLERSESVRVALRVVEDMPEACRELWRMIGEGMRYQEMSERLGMPEGALRARVLRCRRKAIESRRQLFSEIGRNETADPTTR